MKRVEGGEYKLIRYRNSCICMYIIKLLILWSVGSDVAIQREQN